MADGPNSRNPLVKSPQQWFVYGVLAVVIVTIVLRFGWLFSLPLTNDETSALMRLQVSGLDALLNEVVWNDGHPMLVQVFLWYFVVPKMFPVMKQIPSFLLVVLALGFFTSARIAEQVRAGIQALPRGQRYAAMAMGFTTYESYRYVLLPMAFRIILPPLTSESMNLLKNSSVAFAVSIAELTMYAMQVGEETSKPTMVYLVVTLLYALSAFAVNRAMAVVESRVQVPGFVAAGNVGAGH